MKWFMLFGLPLNVFCAKQPVSLAAAIGNSKNHIQELQNQLVQIRKQIILEEKQRQVEIASRLPIFDVLDDILAEKHRKIIVIPSRL